MIRIDDLIARISTFIPAEADPQAISKAYIYSATLHRDKFFPGGTSYLQHALEVAYILAEMRMDPVCIMAGLLHDVLKEGLADTQQLRDTVGADVAELVEELSSLTRASYRSTEESRAENMRQMILASTKDLRVILILLADRLQLMRSLEQLEPEHREAVARETLHIYSPIAHRLGIYYFIAELEDLAFYALEPDAARELHHTVEARLAERRERMEQINREIGGLLAKNDLKAEVIGRTKHLYSIHLKLNRQQTGLEQIYDLLALRIILNDKADCYRALGLVHAAYTPLGGRFKDYIAVPKKNGYQSLHTTIFGQDGEIIEVQIRTREMHRQAELGVAAHFLYKQGHTADHRELAELTWFRGLLEHLEGGQNPAETMDLVRRDLVPDEIFIFTPAGEVVKLPAQATSIDFAYAIHSDLGDRCSGAKMDGRMVPIRAPLSNESVVEIITSSRSAPRKDWLKHAVTSKALSRIRAHLRQRDKSVSGAQGREQCAREAKRLGRKLNSILKEEALGDWMRRHNLPTAEDLFAAQAEGRLDFRDLLERLFPQTPKPPRPKKAREKTGAKGSNGSALPLENRIRIAGMEGMMVRFARCCSPVYGTPLAGIITQGQGVALHRTNCRNLLRVKNREQREVEVEWVEGRAAKPKAAAGNGSSR